MEISNTVIVIVIILIIVLFLFIMSLTGDSNATGQVTSNANQFVGGGCGR